MPRPASGISGTSQTPTRENAATACAACAGGSKAAMRRSGQSDPNQNAATATCTRSSTARLARAGLTDVWPVTTNDSASATLPATARPRAGAPLRPTVASSSAVPATRISSATPAEETVSRRRSAGSVSPAHSPAMCATSAAHCATHTRSAAAAMRRACRCSGTAQRSSLVRKPARNSSAPAACRVRIRPAARSASHSPSIIARG